LYLDDNFNCGISLEAVVKYKIKVGQEISQEYLDFLINQSECELATNKAVKYISKCQKTNSEVYKYLLSKGFDEEVINKVIDKLKEYNFVDDESYSKNYIKFKNKNNGSRKIEMELKHKGVPENIVKQSIEEYANDRQSVLTVAQKYTKNKPKDLKTKQKTYRYLISKGYESNDCVYALNQIFKGEELSNECGD